MDASRTSGPTDHPVPAKTYGGFSADRPNAQGGPDRLRGEVRTYARAELRRRPSRRTLSPTVLGGVLAATVALAAVAGVAVTQSRWTTPDRPAATAEAPPRPIETVEVPPAASVAPIDELRPAPPLAAAPVVAPQAPTTATVEIPASKPAATAASRAPPRAPPRRPQIPFAALDRQVNEAFAAAMRSSVAPGPLGAAQQDWIIRRDRVRREDPALAEDLYRARIVELQALAAGGPEGASEAAQLEASP